MILWVLGNIFYGCQKIDTNTPLLTVVKKEMPFEQAILLDCGSEIIGITPDLYDIKIHLKFNTFVEIGDYLEDGKLFLVDRGPRLGKVGEHIFVIDEDGKQIKRIKTLWNCANLKIFNNKIFITNAAYGNNGYSALEVLAFPSYQQLRKDNDISQILIQENLQQYQHFCLVGVTPFKALNRPAMILRYNLNTLQRSRVDQYLRGRIFEKYQILVEGQLLWIIFETSKVIYIFDLEKECFLKEIKVSSLIYLPKKKFPTDIRLTNPMVYQDNIIIRLRNFDTKTFQKLLIFDKHTFNLKREIILSGIYSYPNSMRFSKLIYLNNNNVLFWNGYVLLIFDFQTGELLKEIMMEEL